MQLRSSAPITKLLRNLSRAFAVIGLTALVYGCSTGKVISASTHRVVNVNVFPAGSSTPAGWTCTTQGSYMICVDEDPIDLTNDTPPVTIPWSLLAQGWSFDRNKGIKVKGGGWHEQYVSATQYTAVSDRKDRTIYKYLIDVTKNGSADEIKWDPFIWNN